MQNIPPLLIKLREAFSPDEISLGASGLYLSKISELGEAQDSALLPPMSREEYPSLLVIGRETLLGDPIFTDTEDPDLPVFTCMHDADILEPELVASSLEAFFQILYRFQELAHGREHPVALENLPLTESEKEDFISFVKSVSGESLYFWSSLMDPET